jgi:hypothetical protein
MIATDVGNCSAALELVDKSDTSITFREHITEGQSVCSGSTAVLTKIDNSSVNYESRSLIPVKGTLRKIE